MEMEGWTLWFCWHVIVVLKDRRTYVGRSKSLVRRIFAASGDIFQRWSVDYPIDCMMNVGGPYRHRTSP